MAGPQTHNRRRATSAEDEVHEPADEICADDETAEDLRAEPDLIADLVPQQRAEDDRHAGGKENHHAEMRGHADRFRPVERSKTSSVMTVLSSPATIRKVLP